VPGGSFQADFEIGNLLQMAESGFGTWAAAPQYVVSVLPKGRHLCYTRQYRSLRIVLSFSAQTIVDFVS
jgi:hypothetical protein